MGVISDTRDRSQVRNYSMDCYSSRTLSEDLMIRTKDDRCNLSSLINSIQISARIVTNQLRNPGLSVKTDVENCINKIWLENLVKSRSLKYIITSKTKAVIEVDAEHCLHPTHRRHKFTLRFFIDILYLQIFTTIFKI